MPIQKITSQIISDGIISAADLAAGSVTPSKFEANTAGTVLTTDGSAVVWKAQTNLAIANTQITGTITGSQISSNTLANTVFQTGSVENYMNANNLGFGMRNRIINGAMVIDQRNAGASYSTTPTDGIYTLDRWQAVFSQANKYTVQQNAASVTPPAGFTNYLGITSSSAYSSSSSDYFFLHQKIEGYNVSDLDFGKSTAKTITLSFWVRSSLTGTFGGALANSDNSRNYAFSYTISSANTWEQKTVTIAGDTSGTWVTNNGVGLRVLFNIGSGSSLLTTAGSWGSIFVTGVTGSTAVTGTSGATFYITGVQLEKGSTATSFDYRPYGTELALCQRYAQLVPSGGVQGAYYTTTAVACTFNFSVAMRTAPTATFPTGTYTNFIDQIGVATRTPTAFGAWNSSVSGYSFYMTGTTGAIAYYPVNYIGTSFILSSEL